LSSSRRSGPAFFDRPAALFLRWDLGFRQAPAKAALFLASDGANFITSVQLSDDGALVNIGH
jgi:hypothetical protein